MDAASAGVLYHYYGVVTADSRHFYVLALRTEVFLEQPQDVTIRESETASFRCYVVNITFSIFWLVNNSDAGYTTFRERGVRVTSLDPMNDTRSLMEIDGNLFNNNTHVHCAAVRDNIDPELAWIESNIALLTVEGWHDSVLLVQS